MKTIKSRSEFERVFSAGKRAQSSVLRIRVAPSTEAHPSEVAFVAPKRLGNAVFRNRCKRVLREAARKSGLPVEGYVIILFATKDTHSTNPADISVSLDALLRKTGVK